MRLAFFVFPPYYEIAMKKLMLLINPNAGRGSYKTPLADILQAFHKSGYVSTVFFTNGRADATRLAAEHCAQFDRVVCVGGDGTLSETIAGLMQCPTRPTLGYIPMGTTNDVASSLGLSASPPVAAVTAATGQPRTLDVGLFNGLEYFTYVAAFGAFTEVAYETPQNQKQALGRLAYLLSGMAALGRVTSHHVRVEWDGGTLEDDFVFGGVTNSRSIAGLVRLKDIDDSTLSDGLFEIFLVRTPADAIDFANIISSVLANDFTGENVILLRSSRVRFSFASPVPWTRDGEAGGEHREVSCQNLHAAIRIVAD